MTAFDNTYSMYCPDCGKEVTMPLRAEKIETSGHGNVGVTFRPSPMPEHGCAA